MPAGANGPIEGQIDFRKSPHAIRIAAPESPARPQVPAYRGITKSGQEPNYREPRITKPEPDVPDNLTQREPKSAMIASPAADNLKPLQVAAGGVEPVPSPLRAPGTGPKRRV